MAQTKVAKNAIKTAALPAPATNNVQANTQAPINGLTALVQQAVANVTATPLAATPQARLAVMQASGLAAQGATALAHKVGNATLGKLPAGSLAVNSAKATMPSKPGFNQQAWQAVVATNGGLPTTLASAVQSATGCSGTVASAHVRYRVKLGWLIAAN
jgi:hypothetical protein